MDYDGTLSGLDAFAIARTIERSDERLAQLYDVACQAGKQLLDNCMGSLPLGDGAEKVVYPYGDDKVIAFLIPHNSSFDRQIETDIDVLKRRYYTAKIGHLLMPKHLPEPHAVGSQPPFIILDRVIPAPETLKRRVFGEVLDAISKRALSRKFEKLGLGYDFNDVNFMRNKSGKLMYVDSVRAVYRKPLKKKINRLKRADRKRATRWIEALDLY